MANRFTIQTIQVLILGGLLLSAGCATRHSPAQTGNQCPSGYRHRYVTVDPIFLADLQDVKNDIAKHAGTNANLVFVGGDAPNAYTWEEKKQKYIAINTGMLSLLGENFDEYAFVIAHEMAHISQGHINKKKSYNQNIKKTGGVLGLAMDAVGIGLGIPFSGLISSATVNSGSHLMKMGYSRDQEREADAVGLRYMREAGFDPWGAVHFQEKLRQASQTDITILSTHPQTEERIVNLKKLIQAD